MELLGAYKNNGVEWRPAGDPEPVNVHDFIDPELGKANPYGVYDLAADAGWVSVGTDHDTAAFAVNTIRSWWNTTGSPTYPGADRLLITADGGGSNGYRTRLWKTELAALATDTGLQITVCHLPPGLEVETAYPTGVKIPNAQMKALDDTGTLHRHDWHPEWNYTLNPPQN